MPRPTVTDIEALAETIGGMRGAATAASGRLLVGIAGAPGAGKSTVAAALTASLPGSVVLPMDGFHLPQAQLVALGRRGRMGAPDTFDVDGFVALLRRLREPASAGEVVLAPGFDRTIEEPIPDAIALAPEHPIVIVEGNYLLLESDGWAPIVGLLDLRVGLVVDDAVRRERLIARHIAFGKSADAATAWTLGPDERNAVAIAATLDRADVVLVL
ncbi:nucleoside/nucleotide kinase family protein [Microcella alkalica]|uniref:Pantothenate kinase n=1 Tax=Microcella alkalica TaxID=355930 RepID=A0A839E9F9_9MICO|nr:nucleoside/nucleotide kinase family protein [Microcella alkalica]MBA8848400.1 pantothenate kinase [Microcella alkalica]